MNTLLWRILGNAPRILFHSLMGVGLMLSINLPIYAQAATEAPDSYILTVERCVKYVEVRNGCIGIISGRSLYAHDLCATDTTGRDIHAVG